MFKFVVLACLVAVAAAGNLGYGYNTYGYNSYPSTYSSYAPLAYSSSYINRPTYSPLSYNAYSAGQIARPLTYAAYSPLAYSSSYSSGIVRAPKYAGSYAYQPSSLLYKNIASPLAYQSLSYSPYSNYY